MLGRGSPTTCCFLDGHFTSRKDVVGAIVQRNSHLRAAIVVISSEEGEHQILSF